MGYKIKEYRLQQKITQEELAEKAGVTRVTICNLENGARYWCACRVYGWRRY